MRKYTIPSLKKLSVIRKKNKDIIDMTTQQKLTISKGCINISKLGEEISFLSKVS